MPCQVYTDTLGKTEVAHQRCFNVIMLLNSNGFPKLLNLIEEDKLDQIPKASTKATEVVIITKIDGRPISSPYTFTKLCKHFCRSTDNANELSISLKTVKSHSKSIFRKLSVKNRVDAARKAGHRESQI
jgi:hypothetical protein